MLGSRSLTAENGVLGSVLIDSKRLPELRSIITLNDFMTDRGRDIFGVMCRLADKGKPVDAVLVLEELGKNIEIEEYLIGLMDTTPTAANAKEYAELLARSATGRRLRESLLDGIDKLDIGEDPRVVCGDVQGQVEAIASQESSTGIISSLDAMLEFSDYRNALDQGKTRSAVKTGYAALDKLLGGGMVSEGLYILAARPSVGKTTTALNICESVAGTGKAVLFVSLEMSIRQLSAKRLAMSSGISSQRILNAKDLTGEEYQKISRESASISEKPIYFNRWPSATVDDIGFLARQVKGLELIVIDYLGLISTREGRSLYEKITYISGALKRLARSLGVPILSLAQLNRETTGRKDNEPKLSDLRDSGAIEQDADGVMLLHCPTGVPKSENGITPAELRLILAKNRHGSTGDMGLSFYLTPGRVRAR